MCPRSPLAGFHPHPQAGPMHRAMCRCHLYPNIYPAPPRRARPAGTHTPSSTWHCHTPNPPSGQASQGGNAFALAPPTPSLGHTRDPRDPRSTGLPCPWQVPQQDEHRIGCVVQTPGSSGPRPAFYSAHSCQSQRSYWAHRDKEGTNPCPWVSSAT